MASHLSSFHSLSDSSGEHIAQSKKHTVQMMLSFLSFSFRRHAELSIQRTHLMSRLETLISQWHASEDISSVRKSSSKSVSMSLAVFFGPLPCKLLVITAKGVIQVATAFYLFAASLVKAKLNHYWLF